MTNKSLLVAIVLILLGSISAFGQTLTTSTNTCIGSTIDIYISGSNGTCGSYDIYTTAGWVFTPAPSSVTYTNNGAGHPNTAHAIWNSATSVSVYANYKCTTSGTTGSTTPINFNIGAVPTVTLSQSATTVCQNGIVNFTTTHTPSTGSPTFSFYVDTILKQQSTSTSYVYTASTTGNHSVYVSMTPSVGCPNTVTSLTKSVSVTTPTSYSAVLTVNNGAGVCTSNPVANCSVNVTGGASPYNYDWYLNGTFQSTTTTQYTTLNVSGGNTIYCIVRSTATCAIAQAQTSTYTVTLSSPNTPGAGVQVSKLSWCAGETIRFTATNTNSTANGGTTYAWTVNGGSFSAPANASYIDLPASSSSQPGYYYQGSTVSVQISGLTGNCLTSTSASGTAGALTINNIPHVNYTLSNICAGSAVPNNALVESSGISGTSFTWTPVANTTIAGATSGSGTNIPDVLTTIPVGGGDAMSSQFYSVTPSANGCAGPIGSVEVRVTPIPSITVANSTVCEGTQATVRIIESPNIFQTVFNWTQTSSSNISGASDGSITPTSSNDDVIITQSLYTNGTSGTVTYSVTPQTKGVAPYPNFHCTGATKTAVVTVNPTPNITVAPQTQTRCSGEPISITYSTQTVGAGISWTVSAPGIAGASDGATAIVNQMLTISGSSSAAATYTGTATLNGCSASATAYVNVSPLPSNVSVSGNTMLGGGSFTLVASSDPSNTYQWVDPSNNPLFSGNPYTTPYVGASTTNYCYVTATNPLGCVGPKTPVSISTLAPPMITAAVTSLNPGIQGVLSTTVPFDSYVWKNSAGTTVATTAALTTTVPDAYVVTATKNGASASSDAFQLNSQFAGQMASNMIVSSNVLVEGITTSTFLEGLPVTSVSQTVQYFDNLGRAIQTVKTKASPGQNDIVIPQAYDIFERELREYLPFTSGSNGWLKTGIINSSGDYAGVALDFYTNSPKVAHDTRPFSENTFEASPYDRKVKTFGAGQNWYSASKSNNQAYSVNVNGTGTNQEQVLKWSVSQVVISAVVYPVPLQSTVMPSNSLMITQTTSEDGRVIREYVDNQGRKICKKISSVLSPQINTDASWAITYYVYDDFDRLAFVLPPEFITKVATYNSATDQNKITMLSCWCFQYSYDERGRQISKQLPGIGPVYTVYDIWDRVVLTQDGIQRAATKWLFTKYDVLDRPVMAGITTNSSSRSTCQSDAYQVTARYLSPQTNTVGYDYQTAYPTTVAISDVRSLYYFDGYGAKTNLTLGTAYDASAGTTYNSRTRGKLTVAKTNMIGLSGWLVGVNYYDDYGRLIQSIGDDHLGNKNRSKSTYYGLTGWPITNELTHGSVMTALTETGYDHVGRPVKNWLTMDSGPRIVTASFSYNELGQVTEKNLHSADAVTYLQSIDYRNNIRGWLESINNNQLTNDGVKNDDSNDLFGMEMKFEQTVSINGVATTPEYGGNITSIQWASSNLKDPVKSKIYGYQYDAMSRLTSAKYASLNGAAWTSDVNYYNETLTYDKNGNILTLNRNSLYNGLSTQIDQLAYTYGGGVSNQLTNVTDNSAYWNSADGNTDYGYSEIVHSTNTEYTYDLNGNLISDLNKGITSVVYDPYLNKTTSVALGSNSVAYVYDASGNKLRKTPSPGTQIDYVGPVEYKSGALAFVNMADGRVVKSGSTWTYEYFIRDHLGNTRIVFAYTNQTDEFKATMETASATAEEAAFKNLPTTRLALVAANHTPKSYLTPSPDRVAETNGYTSKPVGPAKMIQVQTGDVITAEVYARYTTGTGGTTTVINNLASVLISTYGISSGESAYGAFNSNVPVIAGGLTPNTNVPKSYLMYIMFNSNFTSYQFGYQMVSNAALNSFEKLSTTVTVPAAYNNGFVYIYVADESKVASASSVYFDDMYIKDVKAAMGLVVTQTQDYYAYGLPIRPLAYQSKVTYQNEFLFNGKESQNDFNMDWLDFGARMYMPEIGRWTGSDPLTEKALSWSGYRFGFNNPISITDPNGMFEYSDGYTTHDSKTSTGAEEHSGAFDNSKDHAKYIAEVNAKIAAQIEASRPPITESDIKSSYGGDEPESSQEDPNEYVEISSDFTKSKLDYNFADGIGLFGTFTISGHYSVSKGENGKYYFSVSAAGITPAQSQGDVTFHGNAELMVDGRSKSENAFVYADGYNPSSPPGYLAIGSSSIELPTCGAVMINLNFSYDISYGSAGNGASGTLTYPVYVRAVGYPRK